MVAWATIIPAIGKAAAKAGIAASKAAIKVGKAAGKVGGAVTTGAEKIGEVAKTGKDKLVDMLSQNPTEPQPTPMPTPDDTTKTPDEIEANRRRKAFMNALNSGAEQLAKQQTMNDYQFTPSRVDYSQFMGLSPETQRYLYGGY